MALAIESTKWTYRVGESEPPQLSVTGSSGAVKWTCNHGVCIPDDVVEGVTLSPVNASYYAEIGDPIVVTVHDLGTDEQVSANLDVFATFPFQSDYDLEAEFDEDTVISQAEDNSESSFVGILFAVWTLPFNDREKTEYKQALDFRAFHGKHRFFYLDELGLEQLVLGRFDSSIKVKAVWDDGIDYSFVFKVIKWTPPALEAPLSEALPLYGEPEYGNFS